MEYLILGKVIEQVMQKKFADVIKEYILTPAKMYRSDFIYNPTIATNQVYGTIPFFSAIGTVMRFIVDEESKDFYEGCTLWLKSFEVKWQPAGGLIASIQDMAQFLIAYQNYTLFAPITQHLLVDTPTVPVHSWFSSQEDVKFGIGWYHIQDKGEFFYQHQGVGPGFRTIMRIYPKHHLSMVILTSQTNVDIDDWADRLLHSLMHPSS